MAGFIAVGAAALVVGGVAIWYGVDTLNAGHDWNRVARECMTMGLATGPCDPATLRSGYDEGQTRETISTVLVSAAGALAVGAVVMAILTDWKGSPDGDEDVVDEEDEDLGDVEDVEDEEVARAAPRRGQDFRVSANLSREGGMFVLGGRF